MKRKNLISLLLLSIILGTISIGNVDAYTVNRTGNAYLTTATGTQYKMNIYRAYLGNADFMTYCIDAGRAYGGDGEYQEEHLINPSFSEGTSWYTFDVAATKAYQLMQEKGYATTTMDNNVIGELVFRWITEAFASGGCGPTCGTNLSGAYNLFRQLTVGFDKSDWRVQAAVDIYNEASTVALKNLSYNEYVSQKLLWGVTWVQKESKVSMLNNNQSLYTVVLDVEGSNVPERINYDGFKVTFGNTSVANNIVSQKSEKANPSGTAVRIEVTFNHSGWDGRDVQAIIDTSYCDKNSASSQLYMLKKSYSTQRMLVVLPGTCSNNYDNPASGSRIRVQSSNTCTCNTKTGMYEYREYKNGIQVGETKYCDPATQNCSEFITDNECPSTCEKIPETHTCEVLNKNGNKEYWCSDGEICENGKTQYESECGSAVNCTPTISVPSDCNNFDTESTLTGTVSDINEVANSCNPDVNQVTQCVLGKSDLTGESFEATNELNDNPYCKIWCKEAYEFTLPTAQYSQSGGYFTLSTKISGTRDCYTSSADDPQAPIDYEKFMEDIKTAEKKIIDAWNEYNHWYVGSQQEDKTRTDKDSNSECKAGATNPTYACTTNPTGVCGGDCNDYCNASEEVTQYYYEWSYDIYDNDGNRITNGAHQDEITSGAANCYNCGCNGTEGTSQLGTFAEKAQNILATKLIPAINELNEIVKQYNSCTGVISNPSPVTLSITMDTDGDGDTETISTKPATSTDDTSWKNNMIFDPNVTFVYNEDYMSQMNGQFKEVAGSHTETSKNIFCDGNIDDKYSCGGNSYENIHTNKEKILLCNTTGCKEYDFNISSADWIQKSKTNAATYKPSNQFSTYTQYGTVKLKWDNCSGNDCLWTNLPDDALPVSLLKETGVFPFKFTFNNIGQSNKTTGLGRLMGNTTSVITKYNELDDSYKCDLADGKVSSITNAGYVCHYLNNCDNCDFICEDGKCSYDIPECNGSGCLLECENCIYDGNKTTFTFRPVSLNNLFPNNREIGYNWNTTHKATVTKKEIDEMDESVYETPQYSYTLTPTNLKNIREYNDAASSYTNTKVPSEYQSEANNDAAIYCDKVTFNGIEYSVRCNSSFLDIIENSGNKFAQNTGDDKWIRPEESERFTLFTDADVQNITNCGPSSNYACLTTKGIGPSWK